MKTNTMHKCFNLWLADNSDCPVKLMIISDVQGDNIITESTFDTNTEWRDSNGEPIEKSADITWASLSAYETQAETVPDNSN